MAGFMEKLPKLKIQLEDIQKATDNFAKSTFIGKGGFGNVYRGEISHFQGRSMVAFKRWDRQRGQGLSEFSKEIKLLSTYIHENLISLLGFCNQGNEMILVYEYASRGSLNDHLEDVNLTWTQRLKICVGAAKGLSFLHDPNGTHQRVIHGDIKSANILLDENLNALVTDFGLAKMGPANQQDSFVITNPFGSTGYVDPVFYKTYILTKESDVYSFGVVLFEVLCGRLCCVFSNGQLPKHLVPMWKQKYEEKKLKEIILKDITQQMNSTSLEKFSDIAYQCLQESRERPTMTQVLENLETALEYQMHYETAELPKDYKKMIMTAMPHLNYNSESELKMVLYKGVLDRAGKTWFSLNMKGEHCEMISVAEDVIPVPHKPENESRFRVGCFEPLKFRVHVRPQFLSPGITYTVNLVFKNKKRNERYIGLEYILEGRIKSYSFLSDERDDGWLTAELYQITPDQKNVDLDILFDIKHCPRLLVEGIEFQPLKEVEHSKKQDMPILDSETYWEEKLPNDYEDIISWKKDVVQWKTKKELYLILCQGFLINNDAKWFSLANDGKKCIMLPARAVLKGDKWKWKFQSETSMSFHRFEVAHRPASEFGISCTIENQILSPETTYATYLVFKKDGGVQPAPAQVTDKKSRLKETCHIYLCYPQTPVITDNVDQTTYKPSHRPKIKGLPRQRSDGWMEVHIWEFQTDITTEMILMDVELSSYDNSLKGIQVQGIEFRPI